MENGDVVVDEEANVEVLYVMKVRVCWEVEDDK